MKSKIDIRLIVFFALLILLSMAISVPGCANGSSGADDNIVPQTQVVRTSTTGTGKVLYTFAVCGDNRELGIENGTLGRIVESAKSRGAAFIVNTGDATASGARDELIQYRDFINSSGMTFYTVPGNHDVGFENARANFEEIIGATYYSFDYAGDNFVIVDNAKDDIGISEAEMQWYSGNLASNAGRPRQFIFAHVPVGSTSLPSDHVTGENGDAGLESGRLMVKEAAKYPNVEAFFFGHIHAYLSYQLDGIDAFVTGGAGSPLVFPEGEGGYYHYLLVIVKDGGVVIEVIKV